MKRVIFHVDMDAFYASVEQRDDTSLQHKAVIVGADPKGGLGRGVVAACSYEARKFGVHSALPISQAFRRCPHGIYLRPNMEKYSKVSRAIRQIFFEFTDLVEPMSIDEAFLDLTGQTLDPLFALRRAKELQDCIVRKHGLTASIGIAPNKFVAKIASDWKKPNGLVLVRQEEVQAFLDPLPIQRLWGVGPRTEKKLRDLGMETIKQLRLMKREELERRLGKFGHHLWLLSQGIDERPVVTQRKVKSISQERTFSEDTAKPERLLEVIERLSLKIEKRLQKRGLAGKTVTLKLRYADFTTFTRQTSFREPLQDATQLSRTALTLLERNWNQKYRIRLIGIAISNLEPSGQQQQLCLF